MTKTIEEPYTKSNILNNLNLYKILNSYNRIAEEHLSFRKTSNQSDYKAEVLRDSPVPRVLEESSHLEVN